MDLLKMHSLLKMVIFHCDVSLLEGTYNGLLESQQYQYLGRFFSI